MDLRFPQISCRSISYCYRMVCIVKDFAMNAEIPQTTNGIHIVGKLSGSPHIIFH